MGKRRKGDTTLETRGESFSESEVPPARTTTWKSISDEIAAVEGVTGSLDSPLTPPLDLLLVLALGAGTGEERMRRRRRTARRSRARWRPGRRRRASQASAVAAPMPDGEWETGGLGLQLPNWAFPLSSGRAFVLCNELGHWGYTLYSVTE